MPSGKRTHDVAALMEELDTLNEKNVLKEQTYIGLADALKLLNEAQARAPSEEDQGLIARVEIPVNALVSEAPDMAALLNLLSNHAARQGIANATALRTTDINSLRITRRRRSRPNPANNQTNTPTAHSDAAQRVEQI